MQSTYVRTRIVERREDARHVCPPGSEFRKRGAGDTVYMSCLVQQDNRGNTILLLQQ